MPSFYRVSAATGLILLVAGLAWATTFSTILVDGDLTDFAADEALAADSESDSTYGSNNELSALHLTWDAGALYLGLPYKAENTAVMLLLETGQAGGVTDMCYGGAFSANLQGPGFDLLLAFFAPQDHGVASVPYLYTLDAGASVDVSGAAGVQLQLAETVDTLGRAGALEAAIPWDLIYGLGAGAVPPGATLKLAAVIRGALDQDNLGDVLPEPLGGVQALKCGQGAATVLDQLIQVVIDSDGDGAPDPGRSPAGQSPDGGPSQDTAPPVDQGPAPDSHPPVDQGPATDSNPPPDQGQPGDAAAADLTPSADKNAVDQGAIEDQGTLDGVSRQEQGPRDAGLADSSPASEGSKPILQEEGCDCATGGSRPDGLVIFLLALLGLAARGRRRRGVSRRS